MKALLDPSVKKIAVANPQHAPYGQAAVAAMQKENIYEKVKDKFVLGRARDFFGMTAQRMRPNGFLSKREPHCYT